MSTDHPQRDPVAAIRAKFERVQETIGCLDREITAFLGDGPGAVSFNGDVELFTQRVKAHANRAVPARFSVLSGEVAHHLRSCMDYVVWELSGSGSEAKHSAAVEFPIFDMEPTEKGARARFDRKLAGVPDRARQLIEGLQPYHRPEAVLTGPLNDPLMVIHDLDRIDKHRQLAIAICGFSISASGMAGIHTMLHRYAGVAEDEIAALAATLDTNSQFVPQVAFLEFGGRRVHPVVPGLSKLARYVSDVVDLFERQGFLA